ESVEQIPYLPISFFKTHQVVRQGSALNRFFTSSATTGMVPSKHYVPRIDVYEESFRQAWELFYGPVENYCVLALLPAYLERTGSSLVYMAQDMIQRSGHPKSGFYLDQYQDLSETILSLEAAQTPTLLLGVTFALLDFADQYPMKLKHTIVMETGGMKGRGREMIREEVHQKLSTAWGGLSIHSEYGMTELLSQAYSTGNGVFSCPPWMRVNLRDTEDPLTRLPEGQSGGIDIIDLANVDSCSFISTQDLGRLTAPGQFKVLGRFDHAEIRGCNLLVAVNQ
ncbi:MAG: hypothetical protein RLZZ593_1140, partial [Bacteroidota bacterium]